REARARGGRADRGERLLPDDPTGALSVRQRAEAEGLLREGAMKLLVAGLCAALAFGCAHSRGWQEDEASRIDGIVGTGGELPDQAAFDGIPAPRTAPASASARAPSTFPSLVKQKPSKP